MFNIEIGDNDIMDGRIKDVFAAYTKDDEIRIASSSGGLFFVFAKYVIQNSMGVVYGVAMTEDCQSAEYCRVNSIENLDKLCGSKYLQAKMGCTYKNVKNDLENNIFVLFTGVGCQINGLMTYLEQEYENLICVDMICHGVPSPKLWRAYVKDVEAINQAKMKSVNFRCKDKGWKNFGIKERKTDMKTVLIPKGKNPYMLMFLDNYCLRPSCYACAAKQYKLADVTLGDFWGIEKIAPEMDDGMGTSLVILRSEKGVNLFGKIKDELNVKEVSYEESVQENIAEYKSVKRPKERDIFFNDLDTIPFEMLKRKYAIPAKIPLRRKIKTIIKNILGG